MTRLSAPEEIAAELKRRTQDLHDAAEAHPFQRALLKGELSLERYARWLGELFRLHTALEANLERAAAIEPAVATVVTPEQQRTPHLQADLQALGFAPDAWPALEATQRVLAQLEAEREQPWRTLGRHYVLEGSANGGRFIARKIRDRLGLAEGAGDRYLNPYGDEQPVVWARFKEALNALDLSPQRREAMVHAARAMFRDLGEMSSDMLAAAQEAAS